MKNTDKLQIQTGIINELIKERDRQDKLWGEENHMPYFWTGLIGEEFGELCEAISETVFDIKPEKGGYENMKKEAIHLAATTIKFLECLERNKEKWGC